jgi:hypothetical protein
VAARKHCSEDKREERLRPGIRKGWRTKDEHLAETKRRGFWSEDQSCTMYRPRDFMDAQRLLLETHEGR